MLSASLIYSVDLNLFAVILLVYCFVGDSTFSDVSSVITPTIPEVILWQGMRRLDWTHTHPKNEVPSVPQLRGKAKTGKNKANPIISGAASPSQQVFHSHPHKMENPISDIYSVIDNDPARDNLENDFPKLDFP